MNTGHGPRRDPTKVTNQPALRRSSGTIWLVMGGLLLIAGVAMLALIIARGGAAVPVAIVSAALVLGLYAVLVIARFTVAGRITRLRVLAGAMLGMALVAVVGTIASAWITWQSSR